MTMWFEGLGFRVFSVFFYKVMVCFWCHTLLAFSRPKRGKLIIVVNCHLLQYTQQNLEFALTLEPKNEALLKKMEWVMQRRHQKLATVPSTIGDELEFNPFMRVDQKSLQVLTTLAHPSIL